jgi:hypothetical protein
MTRMPPWRRHLITLTVGAVVMLSMMVSAEEDTTRVLREQAKARGRLPVLVGLRLARPGTRADPTAEIAQIRAALFDDLAIARTADGEMAGPGIANVKSFASIPFVALTVDPAALDRLLGHPLVVSVAEDTAVPPT